MAAEIEPEPWMWATDLSGTWFCRDGARNRMSIPVMVGNAVDSMSKNGVIMLNIALKGDGTIPDHQMNYLNAFRDLMKVNGEEIYGSRPWKVWRSQEWTTVASMGRRVCLIKPFSMKKR